MGAISAAPATGTAPDTIAIGVNAVSNPTVRYAIGVPPISRTTRAVIPPAIAHDAAYLWPLITPKTAHGTHKIATNATATTVRRANTRDLVLQIFAVAPVLAGQLVRPRAGSTVHDDRPAVLVDHQLLDVPSTPGAAAPVGIPDVRSG